ncbi:hypothetical protein [Saccharospirillum alexandrii]|uniref:hypothetical protein n=1 Tax=Saccharospirillum alexandrii TaxID=2448477 RepID=UPI000FD7D46B|nr:hypothetical protein [Saccharospirillum alexandrii]
MKNEYAQYMISWIEKIEAQFQSPISDSYEALKAYWSESGVDFNEDEMKEKLWAWVDGNGGPRITSDKEMAVARMVLCLAYKDKVTMDELKDIGFFEDLLEQYGYSRTEINRTYEQQNF